MESQQDKVIGSVLEKIEDLFSEEVGPVASILCDEAREEWAKKLQSQNKRPSLRHIHLYVNKLCHSIDDEEQKKNFIDQVFQIEAISVFRSR